MTRQHWTITTHLTGRPRDVDVFLYDKLSHLRAAAARHANRWESGGSYADALGVFHGFRRIYVVPDGTEEERPLAGIIRLARGHSTPEVVSHEVAHAAQHLYGIDCIPEGDIAKDHFDEGNEKFAYLLGDLFSAVWSLTTEDTKGIA